MERISLTDRWADELRDLWSAEQDMLEALPEAGTGPDEELRRAFKDRRAKTEGHVERLREMFVAGTLAERSRSGAHPADERRPHRSKRRNRRTLGADA